LSWASSKGPKSALTSINSVELHVREWDDFNMKKLEVNRQLSFTVLLQKTVWPNHHLHFSTFSPKWPLFAWAKSIQVLNTETISPSSTTIIIIIHLWDIHHPKGLKSILLQWKHFI